MSALTYYRDDGMAADRLTYRQNLRRYGAVCASRRWPLGTVLLLTAPGGKRLRVTVCDRVGHSTDLDTDPATFRRLEGSLKKGRARVRVRVVHRPHKAPRRSSSRRGQQEMGASKKWVL